jgi:hypothetical protein
MLAGEVAKAASSLETVLSLTADPALQAHLQGLRRQVAAKRTRR